MRKLLLPFFAFLLFLTLPAGAAIDKIGKLDTLDAVSEEVRLSGDGYGTVGFQITGTWSATFTFEGTVNGTTWVSITAYNRATGGGATTTTSNGVYVVSSGGLRYVRARLSAYTSGSAFVQGLASMEQSVVDGGASSSGGGGAGDASASNQLVEIQALEIIDDIVHTDDAAFTAASGKVVVSGAVFDDSSPDAVNEGDGGAVRMSVRREQYNQIRDAEGNERGAYVTSGNALKVDASATTQPVSAASLPLPSGAATAANQSTGNTSLATLAGAVSGTEVQVDGLTMPTVTVNSHAVTNAGTFATQVTGDALTSLQLTDNLVLAEDAAHGSGDPGVLPLAVRRDANTTLTATDGDYAPLQLNADGSLKVAITAGAGSGGTSIADDAAFTPASTSITPVGGTYISAKDAVNDGDAGAFAMTQYRAMHTHLVDANGDAVSVGGGTQYAEDAANADGHVGTTAMAVRKATPANLSGTDGDYEPLQVSAGRLWVDASGKTLTVDGSGVTQPISGTVTANAGSGTMAVSNAGTFAVQATVAAAATNIAKAEDAASADADVGVPFLAVRKATPANTSGTDGDYEAAQISAGRIWTSSTIDAALPAGTNAIGKLAANSGVDIGDVDVTSISAGDNNIGNVDVLTLPNVTLAAGTNTNEVVGDAAHDAAVAGNPLLQGIEARTSNGTAVANGDVTRVQGTIDGKLVAKPHSVLGATWSYAAASGGITNTTAVTVKTAAGAGVRNCITSLQVINGHATVSTETLVLDGAAGTVLHRGYAQAAGGGYAVNFDVPLCGTANTLLEIDNVTTGAAVYYNLQGYTTAE